MATRKRDRLFALFGAILFLVTSSALAIAVVVSNIQSKKNNDGAASQQTSNNANKTKGATMLEGTKLANFTPVAKVDQLQSTDTVVGTGAEVKPGATINFDYTGALASDGTIFQSSKDTGKPITYPLGSLIKGWQEGIPGMKVGGTRRLLIPAAQAYGDQSQPGIPANSDLVFDITVYSTQ